MTGEAALVTSTGRSQPGHGLYMVATPIGAARDITLRALDILVGVDVLAAEDTRTARRLMEMHGVALDGRPFLAYHDHNGPEMRPRILAALLAGKTVAYLSEAGTPLVADPGYQLVRAAVAEGIPVWSAPGASAALAALVVSGLPSDRFMFAGFPPGRGEKQVTWLKAQAACGATLILYESPKRIHGLLAKLCEVFGTETEAALCRELTKRHEEVIRGTLAQVAAAIAERSLKGEIVMVVGPKPAVTPELGEVKEALRKALKSQRVKSAAAEVAAEFGLPRRDVYQMALSLEAEDEA